ncbi:ABC transporter permease [Accumulibacter sp.]|uniref:ABC transporter permease n=1 Tax=Accumulibacter sp. TaxID=2053492 RepID=UPI0025E75D33|nr:ABC transporter permease [Accumulibacter sp.]MCP5229896.1 ABC transporter permease [Accumulibacter sp.]
MLNKVANFFNKTGFTWFVPFVRLAAGEDPRQQFRDMLLMIGVPVLAFVAFLALWNVLAAGVQTSLGAIPGPLEVFSEAKGLVTEHQRERQKALAFYERQEKRNAATLAEDPTAEVHIRSWTGKPTYLDQIVTSLFTVFTGFAIGTLVAVPLGILCGLSKTFQVAINPLIQIFRPVSPLAWLPIVTLVVSAVYVSSDPMFEKSFIVSAVTVTLCSLWPTLINTALGVASIDKDLLNVSRVLRLSWWTKVTKIVLPSSLELIFTGLRLSLGVGWMVLIAAEMLAQNPGLGKFVWDEFQNGSSQSLGRIMVAVFTIGFVGFLLDRIMNTLQQLVSFGQPAH